MCLRHSAGTRMYIPMILLKWQENAIVFPALITMVLESAYVFKTCFFSGFLYTKIVFLVSLKLTRAAVFARNSSNFEIKS